MDTATPIIVAKKRPGTVLFLLIGGMFFGCIAGHLILMSISSPFPQIAGLVIGVAFGGISIGCLWSVLQMDRLYIFADRLEVWSLSGRKKKVIYRDEITTWAEIFSKGKYVDSTDLTINTKATSYTLSSIVYKNYRDIRAELTRGQKRDLHYKMNLFRTESRTGEIVCTLFGCFFLFLVWYTYRMKDMEISAGDVTTITDVVTNDIKIIKGSKGSRSIHIHLKNTPESEYFLSGSNYYVTNIADFVANVKKGDTISIDILTDTYLKQIKKPKELSIIDKVADSKFIEILGLRDEHKSYMLLVDYNLAEKRDLAYYWVPGLFAIPFFILAGCYMHGRRKQKAERALS